MKVEPNSNAIMYALKTDERNGKQRTNFMKKTLFILIIASLFMFGCKKNSLVGTSWTAKQTDSYSTILFVNEKELNFSITVPSISPIPLDVNMKYEYDYIKSEGFLISYDGRDKAKFSIKKNILILDEAKYYKD